MLRKKNARHFAGRFAQLFFVLAVWTP